MSDTDMPSDTSIEITPTPTDEEAAAIAAAVVAAWPRPVAPGALDERTPRWRFSGRWWLNSQPVRRYGRR